MTPHTGIISISTRLRQLKSEHCADPGEGKAITSHTGTTPLPVILDASHPVACGPLTALIADGAIRRIRYKGVEVVRSVDCPIRDTNWGTAVPENVEEATDDTQGLVSHRRSFSVFDGALFVRLEARLSADRVVITTSLTAERRTLTNRAGFTLLHPLEGIVGAPLTIVHSDGKEERVAFPRRISPGQPAFGIAGLRHSCRGIDVDIRFAGEIFEMEDQRNWTDASYKTYCRPLGLPLPYAIEAGETVTQSIEIRVSGEPAAAAQIRAERTPRSLPEIAMATTAAWLQGAAAQRRHLPEAPVLLRLDLADRDALPAIGAAPLELELVLDDAGDPAPALTALAADLARAGIAPATVTALPQAYLASYQPSGQWPTGLSPADAAVRAAEAFPGAQVGVGMLTNFTEFNRCPPPTGLGGFATYSTTAIVHAGDDRSVLETLEALPWVHESAQALAGDLPLRLGLATIGMRSNPYGASVADNPSLDRVAMATDDPRQRTTFAAAFAVGAYAAAAQAGVARIALASVGGPFATGLTDGDRFTAWPIHTVVHALARLSRGTPAPAPTLPEGVSGIFATDCDGIAGLIANTTLAPIELDLGAVPTAVLGPTTDAAAPDWLDRVRTAPSGRIALPPTAIALLFDEPRP